MATKKDKYEKATEFQKNVKMDLDGWPRATHEAAVEDCLWNTGGKKNG